MSCIYNYFSPSAISAAIRNTTGYGALNENDFERIPDERIIDIFRNLGKKDLQQTACVSHRFNQIAKYVFEKYPPKIDIDRNQKIRNVVLRGVVITTSPVTMTLSAIGAIASMTIGATLFVLVGLPGLALSCCCCGNKQLRDKFHDGAFKMILGPSKGLLFVMIGIGRYGCVGNCPGNDDWKVIDEIC